MLDVHPPHAPTHSWRDFFIHIATICIGLLIAIGLEQTVEAIHHHHQRHELELELHDETRHNLDLVQGNIAHLGGLDRWIKSAITALNAAPIANGQIKRNALPPITNFDSSIWTPSRTVWAVAKANGAVALLPENEAQVYARVDFEGEQIEEGEIGMARSTSTFTSLLKSWQGLPPAQHEYFTLAQRDALLQALSEASTGIEQLLDYEITESGACRGALNGARSVDEILHYIQAETLRSTKN